MTPLMVKGATWLMMSVRMMMMVVVFIVMMVMATSCMVTVCAHKLEIMESLVSYKKTKIASLIYLIDVTRAQSEGIVAGCNTLIGRYSFWSLVTRRGF